MPNRIQALVVTCLVAGGVAGGGVFSSGKDEVEVQATSEAQSLTVRAQAPRKETGERTVGRYCRPVLPESLLGKTASERALEGQCIEDSRQRPARLAT